MLLLEQDMSANNLCVMGSTPIPDFVGIAQWLEQQTMRRFESCSHLRRDSSVVEHYTRDVG